MAELLSTSHTENNNNNDKNVSTRLMATREQLQYCAGRRQRV